MYDPNLPANGTEMVSAEMRSQLQGLKTLIDAILTLTAAQVDGVTTLPPGTAANATVSVVGNTLHFTFDLPQGSDGATGAAGPPGEVSQVDLDNGLANTLAQTSANTNNVNTLDNAPSDPPSLADHEALRAKLNELILNGRR